MSQHLLSVNGKYKNFTVNDILQVAERFGVGEAGQLIESICHTIKLWPAFANETGLRKDEIARIQKLHLLLT